MMGPTGRGCRVMTPVLSMCVILVGLSSGEAATSVAQYYRGKQIELAIGYSPGGTYDLYARLIARHLGDHIPGHPTIVPTNMPGAGSRTAATWLFSVAPKDGTALATADEALALEQVTGDKALRLDVSKLIYIGNPIADNNTTVTWHTSGIRTIEDAERKVTTVGATGANASSEFPLAMNALLGAKFKIIYGYPGDNDINLAMERGEVAGLGSDTWSAWKSTHPEWLRDKKINILVQIGLKKAPDLPDAPLLLDLAKNASDRAVLKLLSTPSVVGRSIFAPPGVPKDRVVALRAAFDETVRDPAFLADAQKAGAALNPVSGEDIQSLVAAMIATPKPIADRLAKIIDDPNVASGRK